CLRRRVVERLRCQFDRVPHSAFTSEDDDARPNRYGRTVYVGGEEKAKQWISVALRSNRYAGADTSMGESPCKGRSVPVSSRLCCRCSPYRSRLRTRRGVRCAWLTHKNSAVRRKNR